MKKIISILLILVLALGVLAACQEPVEEAPAATLDDAKTYLTELYKESNPKPEKDFDVVGKVIVNGVTFTVTWTASLEEIKIKESTKKDFYTVDLPDVNAEEKEYTLTATIADAAGATATVEIKKTLPVVANVSGIVTEPVEGQAYKLFFDQKQLGKVLFLLGEASNDQNKYVKTTIDPKAAPDFYVEVVEGGYKIYTTVNNAKLYLRAATTKSDDGKISKYLGFDDKGTVFAYNADYDAWYSTIDGVNYVMGTYGTYDTASISEDSYYKTEEKRLTQYAVSFITKAEAEAMTPTEGPKEPTEVTSIVDALAIGDKKDNGAYTVEKYLVKGTIAEIVKADYGNLYIQDEDGNKFYVYGTYSEDGSVRFDAMNPQPKVGDVITVKGIIGKYNDEVQMKNGWIVKLEVAPCEEHVYDNACDADCNVCGETREPAAHVYDNACDAACNVCEAEREPAEHIYDNVCDADCNECGEERTPEAHKDDNTDAKCDVCGASVNAEAIEKGRIDAEAAALEFKDVHVSGEYTLPAKGAQYDNVTITWTAEGATIANGKITLSNATASDVTVTLKATFTCGSTTETKTYTFKVTAHAFDHDCDSDCNVETCTYTRQVADHNDANNDGKCDACGQRVASAPVAGVAYKLFVYQANNKKNLYFKGEMVSTYYFGTSENASEGVDIYFETVSGGYNMYFTLGDAKNYISIVASGTHINAVYSTTGTPSVFTYDKTLDTMVTVVGEKTYFIGTFGTYDSISPSDTSKVDTNFISHYIRVEDASTCTHAYAASCAPKCYLCGTANPNPVHDYADATCTAPKTCETCKATTGEALGHNYVGGTCTNCGGAEPTLDISNATIVELDMMGTTNLKTATTSQTVYAANGITCTNDKADSTNDNYTDQGTYAARMYKGSTIKVEYTNIVKIVFVLDDFSNGQYLPGFDGMTVDGATIERVGDTVTILFNAPVNVFQSAGLGAQIRVETIKVYTLAN